MWNIFLFPTDAQMYHNIWLRLNIIFVWHEWKRQFPETQNWKQRNTLEIVRLRNSGIVPWALSKWKKNEVPCWHFPHIELLTVLVNSISFYFFTSLQYLKSLCTYHKEMRKDNFTFLFYLKMGSKVWRSTGKNW